MKRQLREQFRHQRARLGGFDLVILSQRELAAVAADDWPALCSNLFARIIARSS